MSAKIFLLRMVLLMAFILLLDFSVGSLVQRLYFTQKSGPYFKIINIINSNDYNSIVIGSSRARGHFDVNLINKMKGEKFFNAGYDGQGMIYTYLILKCIIGEKKMKHVVIEISPNILTDQNQLDKIKILYPFYNSKKILRKEINSFITYTEKIKLKSYLYRFNSMFYNIIKGNLIEEYENLNGFYPLHGMIDLTQSNDCEDTNLVNPLQLELLNKCILLCKNNNIVPILVVTPMFFTDKGSIMIIDLIKNSLKDKNIKFLDYSNDIRFSGKKEFFRDNIHLNNSGAVLFSKCFNNEF